jgi:hypothetical protein
MCIALWVNQLSLNYLINFSALPGRYLEFQCSKSGNIEDCSYDINYDVNMKYRLKDEENNTCLKMYYSYFTENFWRLLHGFIHFKKQLSTFPLTRTV